MAVEFNELSGAISSTLSSAQKLDYALANSAKIVQNSFSAMESTMTFATRDMQKAFKGISSYDKQLLAMQQTLSQAKKDMTENIEKLNLLIDNAEDGEEKERLVKQKNEAERHLSQMKNLNAEDALRQKAINELRNTAIKTIANVADKFIQIYTKSFSQAYNKLSSAYESVYGDVTSKGGYSRSEFNRLISDLAKELKSAGLEKSISISDYTQQLQSIISSGMTGRTAGTVAKYGVIAQEAGFSFGFSNQDFLKTLSQMEVAGQDIEAFLENIIASSKSVVEEVGNAYGFANSNFDTLITSLHNIASVTNMSEEAINSSMEAMVAFNGVMGITNIDTTKFYEELTQYATRGLTAVSDQSKIIFSSLGDDIKSEFESKGIGGALEKMIAGYYQFYDPSDQVEYVNALSENLGVAASDVQSLLKSYGSPGEFKDAFGSALEAAQTASFKEVTDKLSEYQTSEEILANTQEANTAKLVAMAQDGNIITKQILDTLVGYVGSFSLKDAVNLVSNTTNTLSNLTKGKLDFTKLFSNGQGGGSSGKLSSTAGRITTAGIGLAITGYDAYQGYQSGGTGGAIKGGLTGVTGGVDSFSDVGLNTVKNVAKYAAIGNTFAGPYGAAIGAAFGGSIGLTSSLTEMTLMSGITNKALTYLSENADKLNEAYENSINLHESILELDELKVKAESGNIKAIEELNDRFPQLKDSISTTGTVTDTYIATLEKLIQTENAKAEAESAEYYEEIASGAGYSGYNMSKAILNFADEQSYEFSKSGLANKTGAKGFFAKVFSGAWDYKEFEQARDYLQGFKPIPPEEISNLLSGGTSSTALVNVRTEAEYLDATANYLRFLETVGDDIVMELTGKSKSDWKTEYSGSSSLKALYDLWDETGEYTGLTAAPAYKMGIDYVPFDNYPAILHKGEKVMTETEATLYRSKGPQSTSVNSKLMDVLQLQTNTIIDILNKIYIAMPGYTSNKVAISNFVNEVKPYTLPSNAY